MTGAVLPAYATPFFTPEERAVSERFLSAGHLIAPAEAPDGLERVRRQVAALAAGHLGLDEPEDAGAFLDGIHRHVTPERLNALRLAVIRGLNDAPWLRPTCFALARRLIETVVGNELAMQRRVNLSIQLPDDDSSLLPVHADVWSGDSPFEVVLWVPLVDCRRTKSMYIADPDADARAQSRMAEFQAGGAEALYGHIEPHVTFLDIPYGHVLVFSQNLMHGNRVNREAETRWSLNMRFKSVLSPYADKKLGEFFEPITMRPATRLGLDHRLPEGFGDGGAS